MKRLFILTTLIVFGFILLPAWAGAADYYIDPTSGTNGVGSFADPFNTWTGITIATGNDYRQKAGTTWTGTITITASGTSENLILIGAYYDDGGVVHEDANPSYGENCGNAVAKPIIAKSDNTGSAIQIGPGVQYVQVDSLQFEKGEQSVGLGGSNNKIQYCRLMYGNSAVRVGLTSDADYNYIGYNYCYTNVGSAPGIDGIFLGRYANYNTVEYNTVDGYSHFGMGCDKNYGINSHNVIRFNTIRSHDDVCDGCIELSGKYNEAHHNYCDRSGGIYLISSDHNKVQYNIIVSKANNGYNAPGSGYIQLQAFFAARPVIDNTITNNVIYADPDDHPLSPNPTGIFIYSGGTGVVERNLIANNIILNLDSTSQPFRVKDDNNLIDSTNGLNGNIWKNNIACPDETCANDGYTNTYYAYVEGTYYITAADFNARSSAYDSNLDTDPGLANPAGGLFYPDDAGDSVVDSGFDVGVNFLYGFQPATTDLTTNPMTPVTVSQYDNGLFDIGPFVYVSSGIVEPTGIQAIWNFEDGALTTDSFEGTYILTNNNTVVSSETHKQGSYSADFTPGNSEYFSRSGAEADFGWNTSNQCTICAWIQIDNDTSCDMFSKGTTAGHDFDLSIYSSSDQSLKVVLGYNSGDDTELVEFTGANFEFDKWYFVCVAINDSGEEVEGLADQEVRIRIWDDTAGALLGDVDEIVAYTNHWEPGQGGDIHIGAYGTPESYWDGLIDGMRVYDKVLSFSQMDTLRDQLPTITAIGIATVTAGVVTFYDNPDTGTPATLDAIESSTGNPGWYWAVQLSEQLGPYATPTPSQFRWDSGPIIATSYNDSEYYGHLPDDGGTYYLLYTPNLLAGHRAVHPQAYGTTAADFIILNDAVLEDGDGNPLDLTFATVDIDGTGTITIAVPYPSTSPKELDSTNTLYAWLTAGAYPVLNDFFEWTESGADVFDVSAYDGTSGNEITLNGKGHTITGNQTFGDYYIIQRFIHGSTVVLGLGDVHKYSLIPSADTLQVPEGATGCTVSNDGIRGTLDLDEAVSVYNTWIATLDPAGLAADEPVVFYNCGFIESEAVIEAKNALDDLTFTDCLFEISAVSIFKNYAGADFNLVRGSAFCDVGYDTGPDTDLNGRPTPRGVHDIGPYEFRGTGLWNFILLLL